MRTVEAAWRKERARQVELEADERRHAEVAGREQAKDRGAKRKGRPNLRLPVAPGARLTKPNQRLQEAIESAAARGSTALAR